MYVVLMVVKKSLNSVILVFKPGAWPKEIALVHTSVCVCVCMCLSVCLSVCLSAPEGINNQWRDMV